MTLPESTEGTGRDPGDAELRPQLLGERERSFALVGLLGDQHGELDRRAQVTVLDVERLGHARTILHERTFLTTYACSCCHARDVITFDRRVAAAAAAFDDLGTPLHEVVFCVIDLETTGGNRNDDQITEVGAVKVQGGQCLGTFQTLVNPGRAIPPQITVLTGLSDVLVSAAPRIGAVLPSLIEFVGDAVIVGHNVGFDVGFLRAACERHGRAPLSGTVVDTVALARRLVRDEVPDCRLGTLASRFRLDHKPSHRALDDALATADLLHLLIERASGLGVLGLDDLLALAKLAGHPQAAKLKMTADLPRTPGVYMFRGQRDDVLYVGKATNLRQRVRSLLRQRRPPQDRPDAARDAVGHASRPPRCAHGRGDREPTDRPAPPPLQPCRHPRRPVLLCPPRRRDPVATSLGREEPVRHRPAPRPAAVAHDGQPRDRGDPERGAPAALFGDDSAGTSRRLPTPPRAARRNSASHTARAPAPPMQRNTPERSNMLQRHSPDIRIVWSSCSTTR